MKSSTKGTRILQAYSGASMHLVSFSTRNAIAKLAQVYGLSKKARIRLEVLDFAQPPPCGRHLSEIRHSPKHLLPVEEKVQPQKPQKP